MADITMCVGTNCPLKKACYRHTATQSKYQSFFVEIPYEKETEKCEHFWQNSTYRITNC